MKKVLCFGTFDILHKGHIEFLQDAGTKGNYLIIIVISDESVFENKGKFPKNNQDERARQIKKLEIADEIIGVKNKLNQNLELIKKINPDIIVLGYDQKSSFFDKLRKELKNKKFIRSKKFADGIHSSDFK